MAQLNFDNLWIISKLFAFDDWRMIRKFLEMKLQTNIIINPLYDDNAFISIDRGSLSDIIGVKGKWQAWGNFHLKSEKWDSLKNSRPLVRQLED